MKKYISYMAGAIVFSLGIIVTVQGFLYLTTGAMINWLLVAPACLGFSFFTLVIFGNSVVGLGHNILSILDTEFEHEKVNEGIAYLLGSWAILTVILIFNIGKTYLTNPEKLLSWTIYGGAYVMMLLCFILASISYAAFYPKSPSA